MTENIFIITGIEIYSKNKSITYRFMFDSEIDYDKISKYDKYGMIKKLNDRWFITAGKAGEMVFSGGINIIKEDVFNNTVYLMKEDEYNEFIKDYGEEVNHNVFHSKKILYQS